MGFLAIALLFISSQLTTLCYHSQTKLIKPLRLLLGQHFTHLRYFRNLLRFYKLLSIPLRTLESLTSIETLFVVVLSHVTWLKFLQDMNIYYSCSSMHYYLLSILLNILIYTHNFNLGIKLLSWNLRRITACLTSY